MKTFKFFIIFLVVLIIVRLIIRKTVNFPNYKCVYLTDNSNFDNLMKEQEFWEIIEDSKIKSNNNYKLQCSILTQILSDLTPDEIIKFHRTFTVLMAKSYKSSLWEAAFALNGGCSDDCFEYFRTWLIGQGKNRFYKTLNSPRILFFIGVKEIFQNYEGLRYSSYDSYIQKTGKELPTLRDIKYDEIDDLFSEFGSFIRYPELALLAW